MPPDPRISKAFQAMKTLGISERKVKPVLKKLLKLYDKNWELIQEENYRALADAIFDEDEAEVSKQKKPKVVDENLEEETPTDDEPVRPLKRLRRGHDASAPSFVPDSSPRSGGILIRSPKVEGGELPATSSGQRLLDKGKSPQSTSGNIRAATQRHANKGKEPLLPEAAEIQNKCLPNRETHTLHIRDTVFEPSIVVSPKKVAHALALIKPKDEPFTDDTYADNSTRYEVPIAVIHPDKSSKGDLSAGNVLMEETFGQERFASQQVEEECHDAVVGGSSNGQTNGELATIPEECPPSLEIASSGMGEVKISLSCHPALGRSNFHMPSLNELREMMEERCLRSYKIVDPNFSVMNLMKDVCECFLELATDSSHKSQERVGIVPPTLDLLTPSTPTDKETMQPPSDCLSGSVDKHYSVEVSPSLIARPLHYINSQDCHVGSCKEMITNDAAESHREIELKEPEISSSSSLVPVPESQLSIDELRAINDINDVTRGEEMVEIPWVNEINDERLPSFYYISHNLVFQNARVNFSLSKIGTHSCCSACFGDCLQSTIWPISCACANQRAKFVYTSEGIIGEEFLEECIQMTRDPQCQRVLHCNNCPIERSRNEYILEPCKGHLMRNIIKECWSKCGCYKRCGNRVVQRGINCKLQVFFTPEGKGWGLRTLEKLQKGSFVCEFVGEILTVKELFGRNSDKHNCPVLLDAYWVAEGPKEETALCLDATIYGNVARFLNHRCFDANLIEVPVEIDTPEHHYYHLAFFTTREVDALEELTWDYGIDFDDPDHLVKAFHCRCGSKFCRNMKRSSRAKSVAMT